MRVSIGYLVYGGWLVIAAAVAGLRGKGTLIGWRTLKLFSAVCGTIGIVSFFSILKRTLVGPPRVVRLEC